MRLFFVLLTVMVVGTSGYMAIEGWSFNDALYMTIITITTTGYSEVHELSQAGRYFTSFILVAGVGSVAYSASALMGAMISLNFQGRERKKMEARLNELKNHTIVLGFGRMGKAICKELQEAGEPFVVVEKQSDLIHDLKRNKFLWIEGDAADDDNLRRAGIERARCLVSVVDNDADGLFAALAAKTLSPKIHVVVRANDEAAKKKILLAGADKVVLPYVMSAKKVAHSIIHPEVEEFFELAGLAEGQENSFQMVEFHVRAGSMLENKSLRDKVLRKDGIIVVGIRKPDRSFVFAPDANLKFEAGDCIVALGTNETIEYTKSNLNL